MDDYISRRVLLARYDAEHKGAPGRARELIEQAPAADVAPVVHGKWENVPANGVYDAICTNCGFHLGIRFYPSEYCPNCGAKMDKEDT